MRTTLRASRGKTAWWAALCVVGLLACGERKKPDQQQEAAVPDTTPANAMDVYRTLDCTDKKVEGVRDTGAIRVIHETTLDAVEAAFGSILARDNESHDCQRLIGAPQDPLATLWSLSQLGDNDFATPKAVVGIAVQGGQYPNTYSLLHINAVKSCLFVTGSDADGKNWKAYVRELPDATNCSQLNPGPDTGALQVARVPSNQAIGNKPFPKGARWEQAGDNYYIGFTCGERWWCIVGVAEAGKKPGPLSSPHDAWGDEQNLAMLESGKWKRTMLRGLLRPEPIPDTVTDTMAYFSTFRRVATIRTFPTTDAKARDHYAFNKFRLTTNNIALVRVELMANASGWRIRYRNANGPGRDTAAVFIPDTKHGGLGTTRWRWLETDEGIWVQCSGGCCGDGL